MVWAGQTLSTVGSSLSGIAVAVYVYLQTGSLAWLAVLSALEAVPALLVAPLHAVTDRIDRRTVMLVADLLAALGPASALVIAILGELRPWHLAVAGLLAGLGTAMQGPAYQAMVPHLVAADQTDRANGLGQLSEALGFVVGPALATPIVAWWGVAAALWIDLVTFLVGVAATALAIRARVHVPRREEDDRGDWRSAIAWLRGAGRPLTALLAVLATINFCLSGFSIASVALAVDLGGVSKAGLAPAVGGLAMIATSLWVGKRGIGRRRLRVVVAGVGVLAAASIVTGVRPVFALVVVGVAIALGSVPFANTAVATLFHDHTPEGMRGRVFGIRQAIGRALTPLGALLAGVLVTRFAEPAISGSGRLTGSLGRIIGTGPERGPAVAVIAIGLLLAFVWVAVTRSGLLRPLDRSDEPPADRDADSDRDPAASTIPTA